MSKAASIQNVIIDQAVLSGKSLGSMATVVAGLASLQRLELVRTPLRGRGFEAILRALEDRAAARLPPIATASFRFCEVGDEDIVALSDSLMEDRIPGLRDLDLSFNLIRHRGTVALAKAVRAPTCHLTRLDLRGNGIGAETSYGMPVTAFLLGLVENASLETVVLSDNRIMDEATEPVLRIMATNRTLTSLDMRENLLTSEFSSRVIEALEAGLDTDDEVRKRRAAKAKAKAKKAALAGSGSDGEVGDKDEDEDEDEDEDAAVIPAVVLRRINVSDNVLMGTATRNILHATCDRICAEREGAGEREPMDGVVPLVTGNRVSCGAGGKCCMM